jgi:hypothetical protein
VQKCIDNAQQEEAFQEFLNLLGANGGKVPYGAVNLLVKSYHLNGDKAVTGKYLYYHSSQTKKKTLAMSISVASHINVSDLSGETNTTDLEVTSANIDNNQYADEPVSINVMLWVEQKAPQRKLERKELHAERIGNKMHYIVQRRLQRKEFTLR